MRNWHGYVRERLALPDLNPARESRIVRELATQLEDFYRDAVARGLDADAADQYARDQIRDWEGLARAVRTADAAHARPRMDRLTDTIQSLERPRRGVPQMFADALTDMHYAFRQMIKTPGRSEER